ncbi:MAG TPA: hypothetical protein VF475_16550 [Sphingobium sp.]
MVQREAQDGGFSDSSLDGMKSARALPGVVQALPIAIALSAALWILALVAAVAEYRF